jgi:hypothetical protein
LNMRLGSDTRFLIGWMIGCVGRWGLISGSVVHRRFRVKGIVPDHKVSEDGDSTYTPLRNPDVIGTSVTQ